MGKASSCSKKNVRFAQVTGFVLRAAGRGVAELPRWVAAHPGHDQISQSSG